MRRRRRRRRPGRRGRATARPGRGSGSRRPGRRGGRAAGGGRRAASGRRRAARRRRRRAATGSHRAAWAAGAARRAAGAAERGLDRAGVGHEPAAPAERLDGSSPPPGPGSSMACSTAAGRHRQGAELGGDAEQHDVGGQVAAEDPLGEPGGVEQHRAVGADRVAHRRRQPVVVDPGRALQHAGGGHQVGVDDGPRPPGPDLRQVLGRPRLQQVAGEVEVGAAVGDGGGGDVGVGAADVQVRHHGAGLLRQPGLVDALHGVAGGEGGVGEQPVGGDDAGAADAGRVHAVAAVDGRHGGSGSSPAGSDGRRRRSRPVGAAPLPCRGPSRPPARS